jgi:hypothetical protein
VQERGPWLTAFEVSCAMVMIITLAAMARARPPRRVLAEYATIAAAAWAGEHTCIEWYGFYRYAPGWHLFVGHVPVLVPLIWPLVVLSARDVVRALAPSVRGARGALLVALAVTFDATLVEVLSVRAGLWEWSEPGMLGVPLVGILGWGYFALGAAWGLELGEARVRGPLAALVLGPVVAHALLLASWWGLFRHTLRGDLGLAPGAAYAALGVSLAVVGLWLRKRGHRVDRATWLPRVAATSLFVMVFLATSRDSAPHVAALASAALPYLATLDFARGPALASAHEGRGRAP